MRARGRREWTARIVILLQPLTAIAVTTAARTANLIRVTSRDSPHQHRLTTSERGHPNVLAGHTRCSIHEGGDTTANATVQPPATNRGARPDPACNRRRCLPFRHPAAPLQPHQLDDTLP